MKEPMNTGNRASRQDLLDAQAVFLDFLIKNPKDDLEIRQKAISNYTKAQLDSLFEAQRTIGCTEREVQDLSVVTSKRYEELGIMTRIQAADPILFHLTRARREVEFRLQERLDQMRLHVSSPVDSLVHYLGDLVQGSLDLTELTTKLRTFSLAEKAYKSGGPEEAKKWAQYHLRFLAKYPENNAQAAYRDRQEMSALVKVLDILDSKVNQ